MAYGQRTLRSTKTPLRIKSNRVVAMFLPGWFFSCRGFFKCSLLRLISCQICLGGRDTGLTKI